ncbi:MAG: insulinase family protein [Verrucomicrobiales bacterium]|nr:insulinase family protein [Verrucomicrobiales bacterium]
MSIRSKFLSSLLALPCGLLVAFSAFGQKVPVAEHVLSNGMKLLLVERHDEPSISGGWVAKVGSANERPGITGIAHLFEHMMFKGTPTLGTKDYAKDLQIIADQEKLREEMRMEESKMRAAFRRGEVDDLQKPENKTPRYRELEAQFKLLIEEQRKILVKNEFDRIYTTGGGSHMNAFTSTDLTGYYITVPANKLELWMWMESERLFRPVFREFYAERDVVFEERRMRTESTPLGKFAESFEALFWESHPYGWPTVGTPSDISSISKAQADEFFGIYYAPQNITLILVGDFVAKDAIALAQRYFERIPRGPKDPPPFVPLVMPQPAEKRMNAEAEANPQVDIYWHTVPFMHRDAYPLTVLGQILSTRTGRLYKKLVMGEELATETMAGQFSRKWAGVFNIAGEARDGKTPLQVEEGIYRVLEELQKAEVPPEELQKVKNNFAAAEYRRLSSNFPILQQLISNEGLGDWKEINEAGRKVQAVTAADVQRVAKHYFVKERRAVGVYTRKAGSNASGGDDLEGLTPEQKPVMLKIAAQIQAETSLAKLQEALKGMEQRAGDADPRRKVFMNLYRKRIEARIQELQQKN